MSSLISEAISDSSTDELMRFAEMLTSEFQVGVPASSMTFVDASIGDVAEALVRWAGREDPKMAILKDSSE